MQQNSRPQERDGRRRITMRCFSAIATGLIFAAGSIVAAGQQHKAATPAPTGDNHWVKSGPHVMVLYPNASQLDAFPSDPANGGPFVMWKGTKYAHLMVPTTAMPKTAAKTADTAAKK